MDPFPHIHHDHAQNKRRMVTIPTSSIKPNTIHTSPHGSPPHISKLPLISSSRTNHPPPHLSNTLHSLYHHGLQSHLDEKLKVSAIQAVIKRIQPEL